MLESQQARMDAKPDAPQVDIAVDAPSIQARRVVQRLLDAENAAGTSSAI